MTQAEKAKFIQKTLNELYPETPIPLKHKNTYTLLLAVLLSAQATDVSVNKVTQELFKLASTPKEMAKQRPEAVQKIIKSVGLSYTKSKNIVALSKILVEKFNSKVPKTFKGLESLPGIGHKTASVVMSQAFGLPAFPVDTHIHRLAYRWGLSTGKNVVKTESDLKRIFPKGQWNKLHLQMIFFGREYCQARSHDPKVCFICSKIARKSLFI